MKNAYYNSELKARIILTLPYSEASKTLKVSNRFTNKRNGLLLLTGFLLILSSCNKYQEQLPTNLWQKINTPYFGKPLDVTFISVDTGYILGLKSDDDSTYNILLKTNDGGKSWNKIPFTNHKFLLDTSNGVMGSIYVSPFNSNIVFSGRNNLIRSTDGGIHWQIIGPMDQTSFPMWFFDPLNGTGSSEWGLSTTTDGGQTWVKSLSKASPQRIQFTDRETGYGCSGYIYTGNTGGFFSSGGIIKTINGGKDWHTVTYPGYNISNQEGPGIFGLNFIDNNTGYIYVIIGGAETYSGSKIYKTSDGGNSWSTINDNMITKYGYLNNFYMKNEREGYLTSDKGIFQTRDGCKTWHKESDLKIYLLSASDKILYAIDFNGNLYKRIP